MNKKKVFNLICAVIGIMVIIVGIIFIFTPADSYRTSSPDDVTFGADFYTYEYEATRIAAANAAVTANNIRELGAKLALYSGSAFIIAGLLIFLCFFREFICCEVPSKSTNNPLSAVNESDVMKGTDEVGITAESAEVL